MENYFDHEADIGIIGRGDSIEKCFADGARSVFALMTDLTKIHADQRISFEFDEENIEFAFVTWLNLLIAKAQEHHFIFSEFSLKREGNHWIGSASGVRWRADIEPGIEVKGATLSMLSVQKKNHLWEARCIVDV